MKMNFGYASSLRRTQNVVGRSNFRRKYKLPYRSTSYSVFDPCTTVVNTVRCRSKIRRVRSYLTHSKKKYRSKYIQPSSVSSKYKTNLEIQGCKLASVTPPPATPRTRYGRYERKDETHCSDECVGKIKDLRHFTNYTISSRTAVTSYRPRSVTTYTPRSVTSYTRKYERKRRTRRLKDNYYCSNSRLTKDRESSTNVKNYYTNILNNESENAITNKSRAVSYGNKLTETIGSDTERDLVKNVESTYDKYKNSRVRNYRTKMYRKPMYRKPTTAHLNMNREYKSETISKLNINNESSLTIDNSSDIVNLEAHSPTKTSDNSSDSVNVEAHSATKHTLGDKKSGDFSRNKNQNENLFDLEAHSASKHLGDEKSSWDIGKNNKQKKNLFVRLMTFGQLRAKLSNNGEMGSFNKLKKKMGERREYRKKCRYNRINNFVSTQSISLTNGKITHHRNKPQQVLIVSTDDENNSNQTLVPSLKDKLNNNSSSFVSYGNEKIPAEEGPKIYYDEDGRKICDVIGKKINYDELKDDTEELTKKYSRRYGQRKGNKGDKVEQEDTEEKTDKLEESKKYSRKYGRSKEDKENSVESEDTCEKTNKTEGNKNYPRRPRLSRQCNKGNGNNVDKGNGVDSKDTSGKTDKTEESKNDQTEESKNYPRRNRQNKGNSVDQENTLEKTNKTEEPLTKRYSQKNHGERRVCQRRYKRRDNKDIKQNPDLKQTDSNRTSIFESPDNKLNEAQRINTTKRNAKNKKDRWGQSSPPESKYSITSLNCTEHKDEDVIKRVQSSTKPVQNITQTCKRRQINNGNRCDNPNATNGNRCDNPNVNGNRRDNPIVNGKRRDNNPNANGNRRDNPNLNGNTCDNPNVNGNRGDNPNVTNGNRRDSPNLNGNSRDNQSVNGNRRDNLNVKGNRRDNPSVTTNTESEYSSARQNEMSKEVDHLNHRIGYPTNTESESSSARQNEMSKEVDHLNHRTGYPKKSCHTYNRRQRGVNSKEGDALVEQNRGINQTEGRELNNMEDRSKKIRQRVNSNLNPDPTFRISSLPKYQDTTSERKTRRKPPRKSPLPSQQDNKEHADMYQPILRIRL